MSIDQFDLDDFFSLDDFGTAATYTQAGGIPVTVNGIFDNPQASRNATEMLDVTMPSPQFVCRSADVDGISEGDNLRIGTVNYTVRVILSDGLGVTTMMMEKA